MNTEDFVTYKQAIKLKECGFDESCSCYYNSDRQLLSVKMCALSPDTTNNRYLAEISNELVTAPTLEQAAKWLRENKDIHELPRSAEVFKAYYNCLPYEEVLSTGINKALSLLSNK